MRLPVRCPARLAALAAGLLAACGSRAPATSILLVTLDTTRADRLGCYGRAEAGTPVLDALAARGARFERAYTPVPITLPAHASLLTGSTPPHHGLRDNGLAALDPSVETLAETARRAGLRTAACVSGFPLAHLFGLDQGFEHYGDEFHASVGGALRERRADETVAEARAWLEGLAPGEPFFLWVHLFDPHEPYQAPAEFARRFPDDPYQAEISFTDAQLGELLAALERLGRTDDTLVAVTADHGESLGEHGEETHALLLYDSTVRVPLLLAGPRVEPRVIAEPVALTDVAATLVALAGIDDRGVFSRNGGVSLVPLLAGGRLAPRALYLETFFPRLHFGWSELVGLARGEWKYVEAPGARVEGAPRGELFLPAEDPGERRDRAADEPERRAALAGELGALRRTLEAGAAPHARRTQSESELAALDALGYGGIDVLEALPQGDAASPPARDPRLVVEAVSLLNQVRGLAAAGRFEPAEAALARLTALEPGAVLVHEARGDLLLARGRRGSREDLERAASAFEAATELEPGRRGLWVRRSEALQGLGRLAEALECVDRALALAPPTPEFARARAELARRVSEGGR